MSEQTFTMAEIQALLSKQGLDIKDFAQIAKQLQNGDVPAAESTSNSANTSWSLVLTKYPDFVLERKTVKTCKQMAIMVSCNQYYIRDVKTKAVTSLDEANYIEFTAGMPDITLPEDFWITKLVSGKRFFEKFAGCIYNKTWCTMIKYRCAKPYTYDVKQRSWQYATDNSVMSAYTAYPILFREFYNDPLINRYICCDTNHLILDIIDNFGLNNARDFLQSLSISLLRESDHCSYNGDRSPIRNQYHWDPDPDRHSSAETKYRLSPRPQIPMEYKAFKEYVLYMSVRLGFGLNARNFWTTWNDTLKMQFELYGKIKDKYPKNLQIYHDQLAYLSILHKTEIDAKKFDAQSQKTQRYETTIKGWSFIAPKKAQDMYDEAVAQANCLASYVQKYTNGESHIVFMRRAKTPEESWITIEMKHGSIQQAYRAHNEKVSADESAVIDAWIDYVRKQDAKLSLQEEDNVK